jgi:nitric oxide reductase NorD protein
MEQTFEQIKNQLELWLEVEFSMKDVSAIAREIAALDTTDQVFILGWTERLSAAHVQIATLFVQLAPQLITRMEHRLIEVWLLLALDAHDSIGLQAAVEILRKVDRFIELRHANTGGVVFEDVHGILLTFARGLSGRRLQLAVSDDQQAWTDGETLHLPAVIARMENATDNFILCKALLAMLWAQAHFGTYSVLIGDALSAFGDFDRALTHFTYLETLRLEACIARELPGLARQMTQLIKTARPEQWIEFTRKLANPHASCQDSLSLLPESLKLELPPPPAYLCQFRPEAVKSRIEGEKTLLRIRLSELVKTLPEGIDAPAQFEIKKSDAQTTGSGMIELVLDDMPVAPPDEVRQLLSSVMIDFGEIPPEYLLAAGPGEYDPKLYRATQKDPDQVWQGTYHEEGVILYPEWDFKRRGYRKNWCVMRERDVLPNNDNFAAVTLIKYAPLVRQIRRTFEGMRDEDRLLKRQSQGEHVDLDALIEALSDLKSGGEMSELVYARLHRAERNIAAAFLVDMSGSTKGWVNDAQREALVLMSEALEALGDRYAIYGFSGMTRKKCELFRIKQFDEPYNDAVRARISGIRPQDYTRMGFAVRHLTQLLLQTDAKTRLLITLSDGRPEDYNDNYRGEYGIEDTRQALIEARRFGIHPFGITLDSEGRDYLPRLYGPAHSVVIDEVRTLPLKVAQIYRRMTTGCWN